MQFDDIEFSDLFNNNYIMKLYTHCEKIDTKEKKIKFKLLKFIISLLELIDKYTYNRIFTLMGYPSLIFQNLLNFGVYLMDNNIGTEIFEYTNNNHIRKERCILAQLFPSKYLLNKENFNLYLEESERLDLIYELIKLCFGLKGKKNGNYFLFKFLYLTQTRSIKYENLYKEMKLILENSKKKKYNLAQFNSSETKLIKIVKYEKENLENKIIDLKQITNTIKPELPELLEECKDFMNETINVEYYGTIVDMVPFQTQKILIDLIASSDNLSLFRFEYFTNYFTKKELLSFDTEKKNFSFELIKHDIKDEEEKHYHDYIEFDYNTFIEIKDINQFLKSLDSQLNKDKGISIINYSLNEEIAKKSIIRYFILCKKRNTVLKLTYNTFDIQKDSEKCFYLPKMIMDSIEKEKDKNIINIHRIKHNFSFLRKKNLGICLQCINYEKYFKEHLN